AAIRAAWHQTFTVQKAKRQHFVAKQEPMGYVAEYSADAFSCLAAENGFKSCPILNCLEKARSLVSRFSFSVRMLVNSLKLPIFVLISGDSFYYLFLYCNYHKYSNLYLIITTFFEKLSPDFQLFNKEGNLNVFTFGEGNLTPS
ncbi:MAG: hypothetical protein LBL94_05940, partial [Prevotellaceae bacterium]|nr:hypothetical protein [Prevotellaceae bacterium]